MKDDKIFIPELKYLSTSSQDQILVCDFFECDEIEDCDGCALLSFDNFKKWQEQCKDK